MKQATLFTFEVDIHMSCPSCGLFFRYRNNEIPEHKSTVHTCEGCDEQLTVPAFFIDMYPKKKREKTNVPPFSLPERVTSPPPLPPQAPEPVRKNEWKVKTYKETQEAADALVSLGYKKKEAESMIKSVYNNGMSTGELINKVLGTE